MITVLIPVAALLILILARKIPVVGGNIQAALIITGVLSLLLGGVFSPGAWVAAFVDGLDRMAWIIFLSLFGSIYAETQTRLGVIDTIMGALKAKFGKHPRALVVSIILVLVVAGSLLGDAIAAATVIGVLTIGTLASMGLEPEMICSIIVMGASMGSIMPPITQALALSSTLVGTDPDPVIRIGYVTVGLTIVLVCLYVVFFFVKKGTEVGRTTVEVDGKFVDPYEGMTAGQILRSNWRGLIPLMVLLVIIFLRTVNIAAIKFDLGPTLLSNIRLTDAEGAVTGDLYTWISHVTILKGLSNGIVLSLVIVTVLACSFKKVRSDLSGTIKTGIQKVEQTMGIQVCAAFMLGCFYAGGQIEAVTAFTQNLNANLLKLGGAAAMTLIGMLTGSQSTAQNVIFSFFGPSLVGIGRNPIFTAVAGAHLAAAGQGLPPADLTTFVTAGIVSGIIAKKVDPIKSMIYMIPMCLIFLVIGIVFMYI